MEKHTTEPTVASSPTWERLETWLRNKMREWLQAPKLVIGDGHLGIWAGLRNVYPTAKEQRCWNHRIVNALDKVPKRLQAHARGASSRRSPTPTQRRPRSG